MFFKQFQQLSTNKTHQFKGIKGLALPLFLAEIMQHNDGLNVVLTESAHESFVLEEELELCAPELKDKIFHFPAISHNIEQGILIIPTNNLMQRLSTKDFIKGRSLLLSIGSVFDITKKRLSFENNGYRCVTEVREPGEFAVRGGVVDIFPTGSDQAYRLELNAQLKPLRIFTF